MPAVLESKPGARPKPALQAGHNGGGGDSGGCWQGRGGWGFHREWPLVPAIVVAVLLAALLTFLGMYTQIQANLVGSQLPGS